MDNFRRYRPHSHGRRGSTDGFIKPSGTRAIQGHTDHPNTTPSTIRKIGDFKAPDGFHPANRREHWPSQASEASPNLHRKPTRDTLDRIRLDMPTSAPTKSKSKRRRFRLHNPFFNPFKPSNWTKKRVAVNMAIMVLVAGSYFAGNAWFRARQIFQGGGGAAALQDSVDPAKLRGEGDGRVNILLLGRGGDGHAGVDLTDTILIASIDPIQKEAAILSIPRDLYVRTSGSSYSKINAVFANAKASAGGSEQQGSEAGFKAIEEIIQSKIGIPIHYHAVIDFDGFKKAIDTVGGIDIAVPESAALYEVMTIDNRRYTLNVPAGQQHFDGMRGLAYARSRYASPRGDFDLGERQRLILVALKNKIFSAGTYSNPLKVNQLMSDFGNHIQTNLSVSEVMRLYEIGKDIDSSKIASVGLADPPNNYVVTDNVHGLSVVVPRAGLDNYKEIQAYVRNRLRDSFLASENASVTILNGTSSPGLATRTAEDLRSYGYNVGQVADAPTQSYQQTTIIDMRNGEKKYTKRYLESRFKTTVKGTLPDSQINPGTADFVIILGQDEQARLQN